MTVCIAEFRSVWRVLPSRSMSKHCARKKGHERHALWYSAEAHIVKISLEYVCCGIFNGTNGCHERWFDLWIHLQQEISDFQIMKTPLLQAYITSVARVYKGSQKQDTWKNKRKQEDCTNRSLILQRPLDQGKKKKKHAYGILSWTKPGETNHIYSRSSQGK